VFKDGYFDQSWENDPHAFMNASFTGNQKELREPAMHRLVSNEKIPRNIVKFRGHKTYAEYRLSRIYMQYCPYGNLDELFTKHAKYDLQRGVILAQTTSRWNPSGFHDGQLGLSSKI